MRMVLQLARTVPGKVQSFICWKPLTTQEECDAEAERPQQMKLDSHATGVAGGTEAVPEPAGASAVAH